jgi:hypothetical protein
MTRKLFVLASLLVLAALLAGWSEPAPQTTNDRWWGEYFPNRHLQGPPAFSRVDPEIWFNWGTGSPDPERLGVDNFSVRWSQTVYLVQGRYRFTTRSDDGVRLFVNGVRLLDAWSDQSGRTNSAEIVIPADGHYPVVLEYYEHLGNAHVRLQWQIVDTPAGSYVYQKWRGEYFNNTWLSGTPALVRDDAKIDFTWKFSSPHPGLVNNDNFSVRWTRFVQFERGRYRFWARADDGVRVYIDDKLVIDGWKNQGPTTYTADRDLLGGTVKIVVEYYDHIEWSQVIFDWVPISDLTMVNTTRAEYFNNTGVWGTPVLVREENGIDHVWGYGSPAPGVVNSDYFSARWTQTLNLSTGRYRFTVRADDGVRLFVNGARVIDAWLPSGPEDLHADVWVDGGITTVVMEYFELEHWAEARLNVRWVGGP